MKQYFLLFFAVLLLGSCTKKLQISTLKQPVSMTKTAKYPLFSISQANTKTVISPVVLQPLASSKMVLSSQNVYEQAYYQIRQMLQGGKPLSFKKAVYLTENAYFDNELPENSFNQAIADLVSLTKAVEKTSKFSYKYADSVNLRKNYAIYRVLADTLNIANIFQLLPYEYDFEDARGEKEWAKGFVTKLLATRTGNCHSLPFLYRILAEELETEAYLSLLPHHIYLQIPFKRPPYGTQTYFNTELTSKTFPLDAWVETAGYVSNAAVVSGMYMDRLDTKQSIALCLVDLAKGFEARNKEKLSVEEIDEFMQNCVDLALQTAPNLITARLLQVEIGKREFERTKNKLIYKQLESNITKLFADGYLELPELMYSEQLKTIGLGSTYTPFAEENIKEGTPTGKGKVLTLSNGRYAEFKNAKRIETIGSVSFNTETKKIVGFGENKREVEVVSRFLSVDPLARSYPWYTPYQFAGNQPIAAIDLDGLEQYYVINSRVLAEHIRKNKHNMTDEDIVALSKQWLNRPFPNEKDYKWLTDERAKYNDLHPNGSDYKIPNRVVEQFQGPNKDDKSTIILGLEDSKFFTRYGDNNGGMFSSVKDIASNANNYFGSVYIGPNNPFKIVNGIRVDNYEIAPQDEVDAAAMEHDKGYDAVGEAGLYGAFISSKTIDADIDLVQRANTVIQKYKNGTKDNITGKKVSEETFERAKNVSKAFKRIVLQKVRNSYGSGTTEQQEKFKEAQEELKKTK